MICVLFENNHYICGNIKKICSMLAIGEHKAKKKSLWKDWIKLM